MTYGNAFTELENAGEVNVKLSMHTVDKQEGSNVVAIKSTKAVCFVLDPPKETKKKKAQQTLFGLCGMGLLLKFQTCPLYALFSQVSL